MKISIKNETVLKRGQKKVIQIAALLFLCYRETSKLHEHH